VSEWTAGGTALTSLMDVERRHGIFSYSLRFAYDLFTFFVFVQRAISLLSLSSSKEQCFYFLFLWIYVPSLCKSKKNISIFLFDIEEYFLAN